MKSQVIKSGDSSLAPTYEFEDMAHAIETGENPTLQWTREVMNVMSDARVSWGLKFDGEKSIK